MDVINDTMDDITKDGNFGEGKYHIEMKFDFERTCKSSLQWLCQVQEI